MRLLTISALVLSSLLSAKAFSDAQPVHFMGCNFNEGKNMDDMMDYVDKWNKALGDEEGYTAWVMTPTFTSTPDTPDFVWVGAWETLSSMGQGMDAYMANDKVAAVDSKEWPATCEMNTLWSSTNIREG